MADRLESMGVFVKAADLGSFTKAGAALGLSSQMVGRHVAALEARVGAELLRRTTRRQSLTAIGDAYYARCRAILAEIEAADALAHDLGASPQGLLRVNAPVTVGALCLAPIVGDFLRAYPRMDVELSLSDRYVDLVDEGFDVALRFGALADSTLRVRALAPMRLVACAAPAYLARRGTPATPAELAEHDCLAFVFSSGATMRDWRFERAESRAAVAIAGRLRSSDSRVLLAAALAGDGIVFQVERIVAADLAAGRLVRVLPDWAGPARPLSLLCSPSRLQSSKLRAFLDHVAGALG